MIVGVSGTFSSGKDTLAIHLSEKYGFMNISLGDIVREIAATEHGSVERPVLAQVADELRRKYGGAVLAERALDRYHNSIRNYPGVVISGIRSLGEAKAIKNLGGSLIYIDAPIELRFERMQKRQRDGEARISLDAFKQREQKEMSGGSLDVDFNIAEIEKISDIKLQNDSDKETFFSLADKALSLA